MKRLNRFQSTVLIRALELGTGLAVFLYPFSALSDVPVVSGASIGFEACTPSETWTFDDALEIELAKTIGSEWKTDFEAGMKKKVSSVRGFSEALAMRRLARSPQTQAIAEYWLARSLKQAGLDHLAYSGFQALAKHMPSRETAGVQISALLCLTQMRKEHPSFQLGDAARTLPILWKLVAKHPLEKMIQQSLRDIAVERLVERVGDNDAGQEFALLEKIVRDAPGTQGEFALSLIALQARDHHGAVLHLGRVLSANALPNELKRHRDLLRILVGREYYTAERFEESIHEYQQIKKTSNELIRVLSELSWAHLRAGRYGESVGAAIGLQSGTLKEVFAPESTMVMAIALNELCEYPEALKSIQLFRKNYAKSYDWLKTKGEIATGYSTAIAFAKRGPASLAEAGIPKRVATEWIRSPLFISHQDRINLAFRERDFAEKTEGEGIREQSAWALKLSLAARDLKTRYQKAKIRLKPGEVVSASLMNEARALRRDLVHYRRLKASGRVWKRVLASHNARMPMLQKALVSEVDEEIRRLNGRMLAQLEEVSENNERIEIEILNGASQDLVFQNAHPDYKDVAARLKKTGKGQWAADQVYNWGATPGGLEGADEIWEDELGSFRADLTDHCESRERYLTLRLKGNA